MIGLKNAITKFAPKSVISESAVKLIDELQETIQNELEKAIKSNNPEDVALTVFLNVKRIYKDRLEDIVDAFAVNINLSGKTYGYIKDLIETSGSNVYDKVDRIIYRVIEDELEKRTI